MNRKKIVNKTIDLYSNTGWKALFVKIRFWNSPYLEVERIVPKKGRIVDLGCGEGFFSNFLALTSTDRKIIGMELDKDRVKVANRSLSNVLFKKVDVTKVKVPKTDCIIMFHLLHHLTSFKKQELLIEKCMNSLKKSGRLIVVEIDIKFSLKYIITWLTDYLLVPWIFERKLYEKKIYFRKKEDWKEVFAKAGFATRIFPMPKDKPFSHIVFICEKNELVKNK